MDEVERIAKTASVDGYFSTAVISRLLELLIQKGLLHESEISQMFADVASQLGANKRLPDQAAAQLATNASADYAARAAAKAGGVPN